MTTESIKKQKEFNRQTKKFSCVSLFSGAGGLDIGIHGDFYYLEKYYEYTRVNTIWANDFEEKACKSFENYFGAGICRCGDISKKEIWESLPEKCDIVIGGPPCPEFSITRSTKRGGVKSKQGKLYEYMIKAIEKMNPRVFLMENVKGMLNSNDGKDIKKITKEFAKAGKKYNIFCDKYDFSRYGVPQKRERIFIVGIRSDIDYVFEKPIKEENIVTSGKALDRIPKYAKNNEKMRISKKVEDRLKIIPEGKNIKYLNKQHPLHVKGIMSNTYRRLDRHKPSPTIIANGGGGTWGYHFEEPRALTNRERARIQSFPDDFYFIGSTSDVRKQIGNAVPPVGAHKVAIKLRDALLTEKRKKTKSVIIKINGEKRRIKK